MATKILIGEYAWNAMHVMALTFEKEEIMGLLLGTVNDESQVVRVDAVCALQRSDKQASRVESDATAVLASSQAALSALLAGAPPEVTAREPRVVGWWHAHPHIAAPPSAVDLRTQRSYQQMDATHVGVIVECFSRRHAGACDELKTIAFQASQDATEARYVPLARAAAPVASSAVAAHYYRFNTHQLVTLQRALLAEEAAAFAAALERTPPARAVARYTARAAHELALARLLRHCVAPLYASMRAEHLRNQMIIAHMKERVAAAANSRQ